MTTRRNITIPITAALLSCLLITTPAFSNPQTINSINDKSLDLTNSDSQYSFLLLGHPYGAQNSSPLPAASLLSSIDSINKLSPKFMILLGDIMQKTGKHQAELLQNRLLSKYNFPVFNTPGNHDTHDRTFYEKTFGQTFSSFQYQSELFILLDTEIENGHLGQQQLNFIQKQINHAAKSQSIHNIIISMHRLLWAINNPPYDQLLPHVNGPTSHTPDLNTFTQKILPQLTKLKNKNIYIISGDVGLPHSLPLFFQHDEKTNITYIAVGISDTPHDAILRASVNQSRLSFDRISLTNTELQPPADCGLNYWQSKFPDSESPTRSLTTRIADILSRKTFWAGAILGFIAAVAAIAATKIARTTKRSSKTS